MNQKTAHTIKRNVSNLFGSFGYLNCALQWSWAVLLYFSVIKTTVTSIAPQVTGHVEQSRNFTFTPPSSFEMILLALFTAFMVVLTLYILVKTPTYIVKVGRQAVSKTAETITPVIIKAQHKKETKKSHVRMTSRLALLMKLLLIIVPLVLAAGSGLLEVQSVDYSIAMIASLGLAGMSVIFFAVQYGLAGLFHVKLSEIW